MGVSLGLIDDGKSGSQTKASFLPNNRELDMDEQFDQGSSLNTKATLFAS